MKTVVISVITCLLPSIVFATTSDFDHTFPIPQEKKDQRISLRMVYESGTPDRKDILSAFCADWLGRVSPGSKSASCSGGVDEPTAGGKPEVRFLLGEARTKGGVTVTVPHKIRKNLLHYTIDGVAFVTWNAYVDEVTLGLPMPGYRGNARTGDH